MLKTKIQIFSLPTCYTHTQLLIQNILLSFCLHTYTMKILFPSSSSYIWCRRHTLLTNKHKHETVQSEVSLLDKTFYLNNHKHQEVKMFLFYCCCCRHRFRFLFMLNTFFPCTFTQYLNDEKKKLCVLKI